VTEYDDEYEMYEDEIRRLRAALQPFAEVETWSSQDDGDTYYSGPGDGLKIGHLRAAKRALEET